MSRLEAVLEFYDVRVKQGKLSQVVLCPFGHEGNPSCSVDLDKNVYNCFSCGESGDELTLIQKKEGVDYAASVARATEIAGAGDEPVRSRPRRSGGVSGRPGYRPAYRRAVPAGVRRQSTPWT